MTNPHDTKGSDEPHTTVKTPTSKSLQFFYKHVKLETDDCVIWEYSKKFGYGIVWLNGRGYRVHRLALELRVGKRPGDKPFALHKPLECHNRACFNYRHLYWGDYQDNESDKVIDGTSNRGEKQGISRLTEKQVVAIYADRRTLKEIAADYSTAQTNVSSIKTGKSWSWLTGHKKPLIRKVE